MSGGQRKKLFVLLSRVPYPLEKGDKLRAYHQVRVLAKTYDLHLCCLSDQDVSADSIVHLQSIVHELSIIRLNKILIGLRLLRALFSDRPFQVHYFFQWHAQRKIKKIIDQFQPDHIYCQLIRCSEYVKNIHTIPKTLDYMDALNVGHSRRIKHAPRYMRQLLKMESKRLVAYENLIFEYFEHHTVISQQDRQFIYHPDHEKIAVIPNGVEAHFFAPKKMIITSELLFTGNLNYPPNIDCAIFLATEILPRIHRTCPGIKLTLAGADPAPEVTALKSEFVEVTGWMDDIRDAYNRSMIFVAPMRIGTGMQNKLLEAMSMELPCVTSGLAANAFNASIQSTLMITDSPDQIVSAITHLLDTPDEREYRGKAGRDQIIKYFSWEQSVNALAALFDSK